MLERTLVLLKPDTVARGIIGEIITRLEKPGLKLVGAKLIQADKKRALKHYVAEDIVARRGEHIHKLLVDMLLKGPVMALCLEGVSAVEIVRKLCGATEPTQAAAGTIRGDYSHISYAHADAKKKVIYNVIHASANPEEAKAEIKVWFTDDELVDYQLAAEHFVF